MHLPLAEGRLHVQMICLMLLNCAFANVLRVCYYTHTPCLWLTVLTCPLPAACVFQKVQLDVLWSMLC